jgi:hypothetical protein
MCIKFSSAIKKKKRKKERKEKGIAPYSPLKTSAENLFK